MLDRQDIDALLVGALYGELSSADQERLTTHLEAHPADRNAFDDLKSAHQVIRGKVASSRIFELQLEPPQAISAQLLQEAARRAPKLKPDEVAREGWFSRFVHSFIAHPAMAAAATLVLVVGVAGSIYLKTGDKGIARPTVAQESAPAPAAQNQPDDRSRANSETFGGAAAGSAADGVPVALAERDEQAPGATGRAAAVTTPTPEPAHVAKAPAPRHAIVTSGNVDKLQPQDFDDSRVLKDLGESNEKQEQRSEKKKGAPQLDGDATIAAAPSSHAGPGGGGESSNARAGAANGALAAAPPPPPPPPVQQSAKAATASKADDAKPLDSNFAWAKDQHARVVALVKAGKCQDAAPLVSAIRGRDPDYYNSFVASDRALKPCMQYIQAAADREAEKQLPAKAPVTTDTK